MADERTCLQLLVPTVPKLLPFIGIERMLFGILFVLFKLIFKIFDSRIPQVSGEIRFFSPIFESRKNVIGNRGSAMERVDKVPVFFPFVALRTDLVRLFGQLAWCGKLLAENV